MLLLDDFHSSDLVSRLGNRWQAFTDQVMGGRSHMRAWHQRLDERHALCMAGQVSLENRGGFIQVALPLITGGHPFNAMHFQGVRLLVKGQGVPFYLHLKTTGQRMPWEHFDAPLPVSSSWAYVQVPFHTFSPRNTAAQLNLTGLSRLGIVAGKAAGQAELAIAELAFY